MKPIRHILLSLAALACVLPTSAQTARKTKTCTASDMVLIYAGGARNRNWSVDRMKDYVSYTDRDGKAHWLFDGFLLLEIRDIGPGSAEVAFDPGHKNEDGSILPAATQADWLKLIDYYFSEGQVIDAIERSVEEASQTLGVPPSKRQIVVSIPNPIVYKQPIAQKGGTTYWGVIDNRVLDFSDEADRALACRWYIDQVLSRFKQAKFRHVELAGFYWVTEETSAKSPLIGNIVDYCAQKRYDLYWIPYFHAPGFESWKEKGFARAYYQPNHFFHNEIPYERLKVACAEAQANGMDMEVEFDESALKKHGRGGRLRDYMRAFRETGVWERCKLAYYQGGSAVTALRRSDDPKIRNSTRISATSCRSAPAARSRTPKNVNRLPDSERTLTRTMKPFAHIRRMLPLVALTTAAVTATITTSAQTASGLAPAVEQRIRMNTSSAVNANWTFRFGGPYYSHLFIDKIYAKSDPIIPCQSVFDVQIAARLGFKFIEANVHATATPGKYIVMHGVRGCLGDQVTDLDGNSAADVVIRQTPFDTLMSKYRYRSRYAKYRTHITSMEEFLLECRRNNIAPMISHVDEEQVRIIRSIMGENFILYWGTREEFSGPILEYHTYKSIRQIVDRCKYMGAPYLYCMGNVRDFTDEQLRTIAREVHNVGCYVGYAGCYEPPQNNQKLLDMGFDFSASGWDINEIDNGNLCNLTADLRFDDFRTDGTEREAVLCLDAGQSVAPGVELPSEFLSGGSLHVRFEGKIRVEMGDYIHTEFASDGERSMWWSSYFIEQAPTFRITAVEPTRIINMTYKASKM